MLYAQVAISAVVPEEVRTIFRRAGPVTCPEQALCRDVVARATLDAVGQTGLERSRQRKDVVEHLRSVRDARRWFRLMPVVARTYCDLANLDFSALRAGVLAVSGPREE